ncbi:BZ3500_MvSof-1268-A1-R1_Chr1-3g01968 [Microbotryum saponariae]|uniref:BZ3500_MvSof-1268-A1-R1_Chr1-3g01968 protein n=1 Tax=Microbotryum saponariae TaxID=289078 RepID=A0A2X0MG43_9BASI|nr:BZ3500_MvSof-1268-A1-R1_Chr1-3g01968 [Microbotryum saponariae]SCZ95048.1 BZ3501_MvSof-1269-A2-R1_Chr1-3g01570 [Microbotryum saponariae]
MPPMKRTFSQTMPPTDGSGSTPSQIRAKVKKSKKARPTAASPGPASMGTPRASSPPYSGMMDSPWPRGRSRSRSRSASASAAPGFGASKGKGKGKDKEAAQDEHAPDPVEDAEDEDNEDEEELLFSDDEFGVNQKESAKQKEYLRVLLEHFDATQMDRYEAYRRSGLNKAVIRRLVNSVLQQSVSAPILTVVRGFAKVFVGEVVEKARSVANHDGPLTPDDLREGYRLYQAEHERVIAAPGKKKLFVR